MVEVESLGEGTDKGDSPTVGSSITDMEALLVAVRKDAPLADSSLHGENHWKRVTQNGLWLAGKVEGVDREVVFLFGLLHDCRRWNEGRDQHHGLRAAKAAKQFEASGLIRLEDEKFRTILTALAGHSKRQVSGHPTIGCCWDADRYELRRLHKRVDPELLSHPDVATPDLLDLGSYRKTVVRDDWVDLWKQISS